ncbi:MAG: family 78 glycoside hydrolase catalytic domain [Pontiellaceae bacterium]|nr:family 78 glycoside hydrolase catalytic domain [Pontiellaceae bacterium]MBN2783187.1 family 78 glycoside hydrolase catalytic domain [Pontiellaceae bacterium]
MKSLSCILVSLFASGLGAQAIQAPHSLTVGENFSNPIGYHDATPDFSWKLPAEVANQSAYEIQVARSGKCIWDSGWVLSDQSVRVPYNGPALHACDRIDWQVRFRDQDGAESSWSPPAYFELGLLSRDDWSAEWIRPEKETDLSREPVCRLRRCFSLPAPAKRARLHIAALGVYELRLNGQKVNHDFFANGWTTYSNRIDSLTYDVTPYLKTGGNELEVTLGTGWYAGRLCFRPWEPEPTALLLQLEIIDTEGTTTEITTDRQWEATWDGPIRSSSFYDGEIYDARQTQTEWGPVTVIDHPAVSLTPKPFPPVRQTDALQVRNITEPETGRYVFDLGQNMVGWARLHIPIVKDRTVTVRFAEMLKQDGTIYTENYRSARSTDAYTAADNGVIDWQPHFTFHGFRYVELSGLPADAAPQNDWVEGIVLHTDMQRTGSFSSSLEMLNRLQRNIEWGQRGNFVDIPTDCPQRDERMGWTGDAQVFCPTSLFNYDCLAFWKSWLHTMREAQTETGRIPDVVPDRLQHKTSPGWMDAATIIPWEIYVRTGDTDVLADNLEMMEKLAGFYRSMAEDGLIRNINAYGDWLQPHARSKHGDTPAPFLGTAYYAYSTRLLANAAGVLGKTEKEQRYRAEADYVQTAFSAHYFDTDAKLKNAPETQTAYVLALAFDLLPESLRAGAARHLVRLVHEADDHLRTGFLGTPYLTRVLDDAGYSELACKVLFTETYPSWFYSINQGATTMWERWNSYCHEEGFGDAQMNSFNHYAYGAVGQWMYERIAGLAPDPAHPGYRHFFVQPLIAEQLDWAHAELETPYGLAASGWKRENGKIGIEAVIPPNTTATIKLPDGRILPTMAAGIYRFVIEHP